MLFVCTGLLESNLCLLYFELNLFMQDPNFFLQPENNYLSFHLID